MVSSVQKTMNQKNSMLKKTSMTNLQIWASINNGASIAYILADDIASIDSL